MKKQKKESLRGKPITKSCPVCDFPMYIKKHEIGDVHKRAKSYWKCGESFCGHEELSEGSSDRAIRLGYLNGIPHREW